MSSERRFRIQAVARATGLNSATLRAWERRYGVPAPERGENGYRMYSQQDIDLLQRMGGLIEAGHAPSDAARIAQASPPVEALPPLQAPEVPTPGPADAVREALLAATHALDGDALRAAVHRALTLGPAWRIHEEIFVPVLAEIGERWARGELTVSHEHFATEAISAALRDLLRLMEPPAGARRVLLACVDEELHSLPLLGVALLAAHAGWQPVTLGARTPPLALASAVQQLRPSAIALSATMARPNPEWHDYATAVGDVPWIIGGQAAMAAQGALETLGATVGASARDLVDFLAHVGPGRSP